MTTLVLPTEEQDARTDLAPLRTIAKCTASEKGDSVSSNVILF